MNHLSHHLLYRYLIEQFNDTTNVDSVNSSIRHFLTVLIKLLLHIKNNNYNSKVKFIKLKFYDVLNMEKCLWDIETGLSNP